MVKDYYKKQGKIWYDPFRNSGRYYNNFNEKNKKWTEILEGKDFFRFDEVIVMVEDELLPNRLCNYLFELSQLFNRFYDQVPVLKAEQPSRSCRLALCRLTADTLKLGLSLLGIPTLERM